MINSNPESLPTFALGEMVIYKFNGVLYYVLNVWPHAVYELSVVSNVIPKSDAYPNIHVHASFLMPYSPIKDVSTRHEAPTKSDIGKMIEMSDSGPEWL